MTTILYQYYFRYKQFLNCTMILLFAALNFEIIVLHEYNK